MANKVKIPTGTIGGRIVVIFKRQNGLRFPINGASTKQILLTKPSQSTATAKTGTFVTDGTDGELYYDTISGDIDELDTDYTVQGKVVIGGRTFPTEKAYFDGV